MNDGWSIDAAAKEIGMDRRTLAKKLHEAGIDTGRGVKFSTAQLFKAVQIGEAGALGLDRSRLEKEKADEIAMRNAARRHELLDVAQFCRRADPIITGIVARIESSTMKDSEKDALRADLEKLCDPKFLKSNE